MNLLKLIPVLLVFLILSFKSNAQIVIKKPNRPAVVLKKPNNPKKDHVWVAGHWKWNGNEYVWIKGHWQKNKQGHTWIPGHWTKVKGGYKWIPGHWKPINKKRVVRKRRRR